MHYYSSRSRVESVNFRSAALDGLASDGGLFIPEEIPCYSKAVKSSLGSMNFCEIAFETIRLYVNDEIPDAVLADIVQSAYPFSTPLVPAGRNLVLELFHGPTAAFKDFGARFMARAFAYLRRGEDKPLHILVATSGDTGGAVADGFYDVPGISVTVLYPKGRVTPLQEKQIAGLGKNINALAVEGSFDDCQKLAKTALADENLKRKAPFSSANSINIARLIPQAVYYSAAAGRAFAGKIDPDGDATPRVNKAFSFSPKKNTPIILCVPSGNFGNLTAGLYAMKMGAPVKKFIAATNINKTIPDYLAAGIYTPRISAATISNAMDVGAPSNFERMAAHFTLNEMQSFLLGVSVSDDETRETIKSVYNNASYFIDPHSAVGWKGVEKLLTLKQIDEEPVGILCTAHPFKFSETVEPLIGPVPVPVSLAGAMERTVISKTIPADYQALVEVL
jgi:threonine synthase